jgi:tRNA(Ile)-lysidine synthetase-like protein
VGESFEHDFILRITLEDVSKAENHNSKSNFQKNVYNLSTELLLSSDKICGEVRYRTRRHGDQILFKGHHRSIKKMMCDHKIPVSLRSLIPIVYDDEGILCVPFLGVSDRAYCPQQNNALILRVEITHEYN